MRGKRIGVLGDLMLDRYLWGNASRLSPEAAVPVVDFVEQSETLGGAGNVAANIAALGARVEVFGAVGNDEAGRAIRNCLRAASIADSGVIADGRRVSTVKTRIIARHQQVVRVDHERREALRAESSEKVLRSLFSALKYLDALVLSDYDKGMISDDFAERALGACHRLGVPVFVKPKTSRLYAYRGARAIVCNAKEASFFVTRPLGDEKSLVEAGRALLAHFGCSAVVITQGEKGMSIFEEGTPKHLQIPATSSEVTYARVDRRGQPLRPAEVRAGSTAGSPTRRSRCSRSGWPAWRAGSVRSPRASGQAAGSYVRLPGGGGRPHRRGGRAYGGTITQLDVTLRRFGVDTTFVPGWDAAAFAAALTPRPPSCCSPR